MMPIRDRTKSILFPYTTLFRSSTDGSRDPAAADVHIHYKPLFELPSEPHWRKRRCGVLGTQWHPCESHHLGIDRKSTRLNSSHSQISYAVFCLKKKKTHLFYAG